MAIWVFVFIWYIFPRFGILYKEKSGNPVEHLGNREAFVFLKIFSNGSHTLKALNATLTSVRLVPIVL
jgi:hypothetical protein